MLIVIPKTIVLFLPSVVCVFCTLPILGHLIDVLPDIGGRGKIGGVVSGEQQFYTVQVTSSKERVEILVREKKVCFQISYISPKLTSLPL